MTGKITKQNKTKRKWVTMTTFYLYCIERGGGGGEAMGGETKKIFLFLE